MNNLLVFQIADRTLAGEVDGVRFCIYALSGGGATATRPGVRVQPGLINNPYATSVKYPENPSGGPLPCGGYTLKPDTARKNSKGNWMPWIRLIPDSGNYMTGRDSFAIHPAGGGGSEGCIVPTPAEMHRLYYAALSAHRKGTPVKLLVNAGEIPDRA